MHIGTRVCVCQSLGDRIVAEVTSLKLALVCLRAVRLVINLSY